MSTPFKMKGFSGFGNSPLPQNKGKRTMTSDLKTKKENEPQGSSDAAMHARAASAADKKYEAAQNKWRDGDMSGPAPKRSDFKPTW